MKKAEITQGQLEDSVAVLHDVVSTTFSRSDAERGYFKPESHDVPRPNWALFEAHLRRLMDEGLIPKDAISNGYAAVRPAYAHVLGHHLGLRGYATFVVTTAAGNKRQMKGPAIVLQGGSKVAVLTAEHPGSTISEIQHSLLETEYVKDAENNKVQHEHTHNDVQNAGALGPALVVVSNRSAQTAHHDLHALAQAKDGKTGRPLGSTFGVNFGQSGRQDFAVGDQVRAVRPHVIDASQVVLQSAEHHQLPPDASLLGVELNPNERAVAMTLTGTISRQGSPPDLGANLIGMVGE